MALKGYFKLDWVDMRWRRHGVLWIFMLLEINYNVVGTLPRR